MSNYQTELYNQLTDEQQSEMQWEKYSFDDSRWWTNWTDIDKVENKKLLWIIWITYYLDV